MCIAACDGFRTLLEAITTVWNLTTDEVKARRAESVTLRSADKLSGW